MGRAWECVGAMHLGSDECVGAMHLGSDESVGAMHLGSDECAGAMHLGSDECVGAMHLVALRATKRALYLPSFCHFLIVNKLLSPHLSLTFTKISKGEVSSTDCPKLAPDIFGHKIVANVVRSTPAVFSRCDDVTFFLRFFKLAAQTKTSLWYPGPPLTGVACMGEFAAILSIKHPQVLGSPVTVGDNIVAVKDLCDGQDLPRNNDQRST